MQQITPKLFIDTTRSLDGWRGEVVDNHGKIVRVTETYSVRTRAVNAAVELAWETVKRTRATV